MQKLGAGNATHEDCLIIISFQVEPPEFFPLKISKGDYKSLSKNMKSGIMKVAGAGIYIKQQGG
jgi:hypothetical protein